MTQATDLPEPRVNRTIFMLGMLAFWVNGDTYANAAVLVEVAADFDLHISQAALAVTAEMLPFGLFALLFGPLADRFGKARVIKAAAIATAVFSGLGALASDLTSLCVVRALKGACAAAVAPVAMSYIGDRLEGRPVALQGAINKFFGLTFLGGASGTVVAGAVASLGSWRLVYLVFGLMELLVAGVMLGALQDVHRAPSRSGIKGAVGAILSSPRLLKTAGVIFLMGATVFGSFTYAGKVVESRTGYGILQVGLLLASFGVAALLGAMFAPALRRRLGGRLFSMASGLACVALGTLGVWTHPLGLSLSLAGLGFGFILIHPALVAEAQAALPGRRGTAMSVVAFAMLTGGGLGAWMNSSLLPAWGFGGVFGLAAILVLVVGLLTSGLVGQSTPVERAC